MRTLSFLSSLKRAIPFCAIALTVPAATLSQTLPPASQLADQIDVGWNIGNSLEVPGGETGWGNPVYPDSPTGSERLTGSSNTAGAACHRASATINGWGCYSIYGRTITVSRAATTK